MPTRIIALVLSLLLVGSVALPTHAQPDTTTYTLGDGVLSLDHPADWRVTNAEVDRSPSLNLTLANSSDDFTVELNLLTGSTFAVVGVDARENDLESLLEIVQLVFEANRFGDDTTFASSAIEVMTVDDREYAVFTTTVGDPTATIISTGLLRLAPDLFLRVDTTQAGDLSAVADNQAATLALLASIEFDADALLARPAFDVDAGGNTDMAAVNLLTEQGADPPANLTFAYPDGWGLEISVQGEITFTDPDTTYQIELEPLRPVDLDSLGVGADATSRDAAIGILTPFFAGLPPTVDITFLSGVIAPAGDDVDYSEVIFIVTQNNRSRYFAYGVVRLSDGRYYSVNASMPVDAVDSDDDFYGLHGLGRAIISRLGVA